MSTQPFDIGLVRDRIRQGVSDKELRQVQGSADYAAVQALRDFPAPCCYVLLAREMPLETKTGASIPGQQARLAQLVEVNFAVVSVCRNYREQRGAQVIDELRILLGKVRQPLLGWTPPIAGGRACQLIEGNLEDYDAATALWVDVWKTQALLQPEIPR